MKSLERPPQPHELTPTIETVDPHRINTAILATLMLLAALPVMAIIAAMVKLSDGGPVFFLGTRLGCLKSPFRMLKFRTLVLGAEKRIAGDILSKKMADQYQLEHRYGRFLRETRLDELPQLINIIKGDMDFVGPRPIRPQVYAQQCRGVPEYDTRFLVRPGLIGPSQVYTPHNAPQRIRSLLDNRLIQHRRSFLGDLRFLGLVFGTLLARIPLRGWHSILEWYCTTPLFGRFGNQRRSPRIEQGGTAVRFCELLQTKMTAYLIEDQDRDVPRCDGGVLANLSNEGMLIYSNRPLNGETVTVRMEKVVTCRRGRKRIRVAYAHGTILKQRQTPAPDHNYEYVIEYRPASPFNQYMIHKYFLNESIL